jgi:hypothetical protein
MIYQSTALCPLSRWYRVRSRPSFGTHLPVTHCRN